jgi:hypothetical protein
MPPPRPHARQPAPVRVERIATTPMTRPQHDQAAAALAELITAWQHGPAAEPGEDPASLLPLPAQASNTDHAAAPALSPITARTRKPRHDLLPGPAGQGGRARR